MRDKIGHFTLLYCCIIFIFFYSLTYAICIVNCSEVETKAFNSRHSTVSIFNKLCVILSGSDITIEISSFKLFTLNSIGKKYFIDLLKKIPLMHKTIISLDTSYKFQPPMNQPDLIINIYKKFNSTQKLMLQIVYFSKLAFSNSTPQNDYGGMYFSTFNIDAKQIPDFIFSVWGKEACNLALEIEAIYKKQQQSPSK